MKNQKTSAGNANNDIVGESAVAEATRYIGLGWRVFPCAGKDPAVAMVPHGLHDATDDPKRVDAWWPKRSRRNIGATPPAGCFVLDVDTYKPGVADALAPLLAVLNALDTPRQRSGGGGVHYLLRGKPPSASPLRKAWGIGEGIDIKASGRGYVLLAPSVHPDTGAIYAWETEPETPIADAPGLMPDGSHTPISGIVEGVARPPMLLSIEEFRQVLQELPAHWWNGYDNFIKGGMVSHHQTGGSFEGLALWREQAARATDPTAYEDGAFDHRWNGFGRDGVTLTIILDQDFPPARARHFKSLHAGREFGPVKAGEPPVQRAANDERDDCEFRLVNPLLSAPRITRDILSGPIRLPDEPEMVICYGPSGSFKSAFVEGMLVYAGAGVTLNHRLATPRVVVYAAEEAPALFDNNLHSWRQFFGKALGGELRSHALRNLEAGYFQRFDGSVGGLDDKAARRIAERVAETKARLSSAARAIVCLDPLAEVMEGDENSTADMRRYIAAGRVVQRNADALVVNVHHSGHSSSDRERGNSALPAAGFARYHVERVGGPSGMRFRVECKKWKGGGAFPKPSEWSVLVEDLRLAVPDLQDGEDCSGIVVEHVGQASPKPTKADIEAEADERDLAKIVNAYNCDPKVGGTTLRAILECGGPKLQRLQDLAISKGYLARGKGAGRASYIATDAGRQMAGCEKPADDDDYMIGPAS